MYINESHKNADQLMDQQKFDKALIAFNDALKNDPDHPTILSQRGVLYLHMNQKKKCFDDLLLALKLEPDNGYRYASLAYARDFFGDLDGAIREYEKAVEIDPDDAIAHNNLGLLLEKKGYQSKAQERFNRADKLAKLEKKFFEAVDKREPLPENNQPKPTGGETLQPKKLEDTSNEKKSAVVKNVFTKKETFKEFMTFIKNGFKLKKND